MRKLIPLVLILTIVACRRDEKPVATTTTTNDTPSARGAATTTSTTAAQTTTASGFEVGAKMPAYTAKMLDGSPFDIAKRDKVVLLNLWATWCGPCRYEIPELEQIHTKHAAQGFEVVGVSVDETGPEAVQEFVTAQKMTYPVVLDPEGKLANIFETTVLPTSVVIDRSGTIVWKKAGAIMPNDAELLKAIETALKP